MKEINRYFDIAFDSVHEPIFFIDSSLSITFCNAAFRSLAELTNILNVDVNWVTDFWPDVKRELKAGVISSYFKVQGENRGALLEISEIEPGQLFMVRVASLQSESEVLQDFHSQRLATLGMLASGIAHDFNNILTGLLGHVTYLKTILPQSGTHVQSLSALEEGARKASIMTQEILNFSRADSGERPAKVELGDILKRTFNLLRGAISPEYELTISRPSGPVCVLADEAKITQVIVNLVINSRDAIHSDGRIDVSLAVVESNEELTEVFGARQLSAERYARLTVEDDGHGMSDEVLERMFEPYYSTKGGKGTGLGLSIVREIVGLFAGAIRVESELNRGSKISVYLPILMEEAKQPAKKPSQEQAPQGGSERILIVDDEFPVRNVLSLSLEHLGYTVEIASSGIEAIEKYGPERFDLVILDMLMPNLSGDETFFKLKDIDPNVRVLVISGYSSEEAIRNILDNGGLGFVQKPFTIGELAKRVRQCFDEKL
ncbi:MAG: response regulator [Deltaproteobacteria bacterium]|nr:response regulator [Deltaproteobacteria bacterium]